MYETVKGVIYDEKLSYVSGRKGRPAPKMTLGMRLIASENRQEMYSP